jgi:hypothetical protein
VLVNERGDIVYINGRTGRYLEPAAGKANWNVHVMARPGLRTALAEALHRANAEGQPVDAGELAVDDPNGLPEVHLHAQPLDAASGLQGMTLLIFRELEARPARRRRRGSNTDRYQLEADLQRSREDAQSLREEMRASQEELQAANEELQSTNEELQSTNEELTSSKEAMQSMNNLKKQQRELEKQILDSESQALQMLAEMAEREKLDWAREQEEHDMKAHWQGMPEFEQEFIDCFKIYFTRTHPRYCPIVPIFGNTSLRCSS